MALASFASVNIATAAGPPLPTATNGKPVSVVATGIPTPTSFAFYKGNIFVSAGGNPNNGKGGGVYVVRKGKGVLLPGSPPFVAGLALRGNTLYVSAGPKILAWTGWNGSHFTHVRLVVKGPANFSGFNGLAFGHDGRLYSGVSLPNTKKADFTHGATPYANDVVSVSTKGGLLKVVSVDVRQPWQLLFTPGRNAPIVSDLGQDNLGKKEPPDALLRAHQGDDFGFPTCNWVKMALCAGFAPPMMNFPAHADPMGLGMIGNNLYVSLFGGLGKGPEVIRTSPTGGADSAFMIGFAAPVVGLGTHAGRVYVGDLTSTVYSVAQ